MSEIIQKCTIQKSDSNQEKHEVTQLQLKVICSISDPNNPNKRINGTIAALTVNSGDKLADAVKASLNSLKNQNAAFGPCKADDFLVRYNNRLYKNGTIGDCHIQNKRTIELVNLQSDQQSVLNQGFIFAYWSIVPLILSVSFLIAATIGRFNVVTRGLYLLTGTIILVPSLMSLIVGISELKSERQVVSFVGTQWFGECCCCNGCCVDTICSCCVYEPKQNDDLDDIEPNDQTPLIEHQN